MKDSLYTYKVLDIRVIDGDTVDLVIDLGFYLYRKIRLRLVGFNAPEIRGKKKEEGLIAKEKLKKILSQKSSWIVKTYKDTGIYGRYYGELISVDGKINANKEMERALEEMHAH